jgi:hypothetical protein
MYLNIDYPETRVYRITLDLSEEDIRASLTNCIKRKINTKFGAEGYNIVAGEICVQVSRGYKTEFEAEQWVANVRKILDFNH